MITKLQAIHSLRPNSSFEIEEDVIRWLDTNTTIPTETEINTELARLQAEYNAKEYQRKRAAEYPSYADQFDTIFHQGLDVWKAQIQAIKDKYPKS